MAATNHSEVQAQPLTPAPTPPLPPQFECYEYLFEAAVRMRQLGLDASRAPPPPLPAAVQPATANGTAAEGGEPAAKKARVESGTVAAGSATATASGRLPTAVVLDIEGTIAAISFVTDVLFPYARQRLRCGQVAGWLRASYALVSCPALHLCNLEQECQAHLLHACDVHEQLHNPFRTHPAPTFLWRLSCAPTCRSSHLASTYDSEETQADLELLRQQAAQDAAAGLTVPPIP